MTDLTPAQLLDYIAHGLCCRQETRMITSRWWDLPEERREHYRQAAREDVEAWVMSQEHPTGNGSV